MLSCGSLEPAIPWQSAPKGRAANHAYGAAVEGYRIVLNAPCSQGAVGFAHKSRSYFTRLGLAGLRPCIIEQSNDQPCEDCGPFWNLSPISKELSAEGHLAATHPIKGSQWLVLVEALSSETVRIAVQRVIERTLTKGCTMKRALRTGSS